MADTDPILPVLPVLAYADPVGQQPLDGRLMVEYRDGAVIITDPGVAETSLAIFRWMGSALLFLAGVFALGAAAGTIFFRYSDGAHLTAELVAGICFLFGWLATLRIKRRTRVVRVVSGRVYTKGCLGHDRLSGLFRPRGFVVIAGSTDLSKLRTTYCVYVRYAWRISFIVIRDVWRDEAVWASRLLSNALANGGLDDTHGGVTEGSAVANPVLTPVLR